MSSVAWGLGLRDWGSRLRDWLMTLLLAAIQNGRRTPSNSPKKKC